MDRDDAWQAAIRAALQNPDEPALAPPNDLASRAIATGTRRLTARARARAVSTGALVALGLLVCAWAWARAESIRTADFLLTDGAPWTP